MVRRVVDEGLGFRAAAREFAWMQRWRVTGWPGIGRRIRSMWRIARIGHCSGELSQHAAHLPCRCELCALVAIVEIDERLGLDENRLARIGRIVNDTRDTGTHRRFDGQDIALTTHREKVVLQVLSKILVLEIPFDLTAHSAM